MIRLLTQREAAVWLSLSERTGFTLLAVVLSLRLSQARMFRDCQVMKSDRADEFNFGDETPRGQDPGEVVVAERVLAAVTPETICACMSSLSNPRILRTWDSRSTAWESATSFDKVYVENQPRYGVIER
jgi:hypothetical protein